MERAQRAHTWRFALACCVAGATLATCGGDASAPPNPPNDTVATLALAPTVLDLTVGGSGGLAAIAYNAAGAPISGVTFAWSSAHPGIATVSAAGLVTGVAVGTTTVMATAGGVQRGAVVNVTNSVTPVALLVAPAAASTTVGGSAAFSIIALDVTGAIVTAPPVTWTSSAQSVATISATGTAVGVTVGTTQIQAAAGTLVATPATLTVSAATASCSDIASQSRWMVQLSWDWARTGTNADNHRISAVHTGIINGGPMSRSFANPTSAEWTSEPGFWGSGSVNDSDTDLNSQPQTTRTLIGNGDFASTLVGQELPRLVLQVDLTNCTYRFEMPVQITMTLTESDGTASTAVLALGALRTAWIPLNANWRQLNLSDIISAQFPVHSLGWLIAGNAFETSYVPFGFGQLLFVGSAGANEAPQGTATVTAVFSPIS